MTFGHTLYDLMQLFYCLIHCVAVYPIEIGFTSMQGLSPLPLMLK